MFFGFKATVIPTNANVIPTEVGICRRANGACSLIGNNPLQWNNMKEKRTEIYYSDELGDEFSTAEITARKIDETYDYGGKSLGWKIIHFFLYFIVGWPVAWLYMKIFWAHKIVNRKVFNGFESGAIFLYGNHTSVYFDALVPAFVSRPRHAFVIVHPNNVSIPVVGRILPFVGALPLPDNLAAGKNFMDTMKFHVQNGRSIAIYPEAHIWPFYTKIRPFIDASFKYPVQFGAPVFCFTNTYQKRRFFKSPKIVTYVDGPFFPDEGLGQKESRKNLRDKVFSKMTERSDLNTVEVIKYIRKEK